MKKIIMLFFVNLITNFASYSQVYKELITKADSLYNIKEYSKSSEFYRQAYELGDKDFNDLYNGACSASLAGKKEQAFKLLNLSVQNGWTDINHLKTDSDLDTLHKDSSWNILINKVQKITDSIEANYDKPLKNELEEIFKDDQNIRNKYVATGEKLGYKDPKVDSLGKIMIYKDSINQIKVIQILDTKGWMGKEKVGVTGNQALFLVMQHAGLKTQEKYLPMMREAVKNGALNQSFFAALEDRVALRQGKKQIYGTQIGINSELKINYVQPLEDPDNVDKRRASVGLHPIAEYVKKWGIIWNVEEYKKQLPEIEKWNKQ